MPKTQLHGNGTIRQIYISNFLHTSLWSFVTAQRRCNRDVNEAIRDFMRFCDIEDLEFDALKRAYYRRNEEFFEATKDVTNDAKVVFDTKPDEVKRVLSRIENLVNLNSNAGGAH